MKILWLENPHLRVHHLLDQRGIVKDKCNFIKRHNISRKVSEKRSLTPRREMNFSRGKRLYTEWCSKKQRSGIACLLAGVLQLKGISKNTDNGRCPLCLGAEDLKHMLLCC
jgi:hypothetical protein